MNRAWIDPIADDAGFILLDALMAVVLVSAVGGIVYGVGTNLIGALDRQLDRSMALATMDMMSKQLLATGFVGGVAGLEDDVFIYHIERAGSVDSYLATFTIVARSKAVGSTISLSFLAPRGEQR